MAHSPNSASHKSSLSSSLSSLNSSEHECTVYLGDLDDDIDEKKLREYFRYHSMPVAKITRQRNMSFAHVTFGDASTAKSLLRHAIIHINSKPVRVMPFSQPNKFNPKANLIVKNLELYVTESDLISRFQACGKILSCKVARHKNGESRCYAFVQFENESDAARAIDQFNNSYWNPDCDPDVRYRRWLEAKENGLIASTAAYDSFNQMHGKKIYVGEFMTKDEYSKVKQDKDGKQSNLYVSNFGPRFGDRDLYELFKRFGRIKSAKVRRDKRENIEVPLGCGFVDFEFPDDAERACRAVNGEKLANGRIVSVKFADCKSRKMRKKLESEANEGGSSNSSISSNGSSLYEQALTRDSESSSSAMSYETDFSVSSVSSGTSTPRTTPHQPSTSTTDADMTFVELEFKPASQVQNLQTSVDQNEPRLMNMSRNSPNFADSLPFNLLSGGNENHNNFSSTLSMKGNGDDLYGSLTSRAFLPRDSLTDWVEKWNQELGPNWNSYKLFDNQFDLTAF